MSLTAVLTAVFTASSSSKKSARLCRMRITLPSGTFAEIDTSVKSPSMGLVISPDIFSLRPLFTDMVARLAQEWNMAVCAVEPFPGRTLGADIEARMSAVASLDDAAHLRDLHEAADALGTTRLGLMGFCMGGMYCFKSAVSERFTRIVSFYGMIRMPANWQSPTQGEPLLYLSQGDATKVMAIIGTKDPYTPSDDVDALRATGCHVVEYQGAEHGFAHDAARPAHLPAQAADAFARTRSWLEGQPIHQ